MAATRKLGLLVGALAALASTAAQAADDVAGKLIVFNDNGGWSWFEDERAIVDPARGKILVSSVANGAGLGGADRHGDVDVATLDLASGHVSRYSLHEGLQADDHDSAALWIRPDGRYLAAYSQHHGDSLTRFRISANPGDPSDWSPESTFDQAAGTTYSNLHYLAAEQGGAGRLYNFARTVGFNPNFNYSDDAGRTWVYGGRLLRWPRPQGDPKFTGRDGARPYLKYASNGADEVHFITTEDHPRAYDNSVYHGVLRGGALYDSGGAVVDDTAFDGTAPRPTAFTPVFDSDASELGFAWTCDLQLDSAGRPYAALTARANNSDRDHRFLYARFEGAAWRLHEVARAGGYLYEGENDYTGLMALDPDNPDRVFISTNIDPGSHAALPRYEIFAGVTADGGATWSWRAVTSNSTVDNLRPVVPKWDGQRTALLWLRGKYAAFTRYDLQVVGVVWRDDLL